MNEQNLYRVWDPLYGRIDFGPFEKQIISSPEFQRLRYIRMCNINSMLITGASEINRFEHCLGVMRLAQEWLRFHPGQIKSDHSNNLIAAALLHDMVTGPFGHSLQYVLEDNEVEGNFTHDDVEHSKSSGYYQDITAGATFAGRPFSAEHDLHDRWPEITELIRGHGRHGPLISGAIDLDNIDNVVRLAYHAGVATKGDANVALGLARDMEPHASGISISEKSLEHISRWQEIRHDLYQLLLLDWAEFSAKAMLTLATELAIEYRLIGADSWKLTDLEYLGVLENGSHGESQSVGDIVKRLRCGDLYAPVALLSSGSVEMYKILSTVDSKREFESELSAWAKDKYSFKSPFLIHYILDWGKTDRAVETYIRDRRESVVVGFDSKRLLIGVFSTKHIASAVQREGVSQKLYSMLEQRGVGGLKNLDDPVKSIAVSKDAPAQIELL